MVEVQLWIVILLLSVQMIAVIVYCAVSVFLRIEHNARTRSIDLLLEKFLKEENHTSE